MAAKSHSLTAERAAMHRSVHQMIDDPLVFDDHLAVHIMGARNRETLEAFRKKLSEMPGADFLRAFIAARSRYAEDSLGEAVRGGLRQYVLLGAGLDTFAYRNPYMREGLRVFEVDHPATQFWKRALLAEAGIHVPLSLTFVPVDFEAETITDKLRQGNFNHGEPAFFSLLGVTPYLTRDSIFSTFKLVAAMKKRSSVVFDYVLSPALLNERQRAAFAALSMRVAGAGEPWQTLFDPAALAEELSALGFSSIEDLGPDEINARYFAGRDDNLYVRGFGHIMKAVM
ncbi:MAG TPA: SAM-dependent methyltransferase [Syntrophales bacterium]|nr:SAM-dependent methyltransferase [Syntrophales bacterium]